MIKAMAVNNSQIKGKIGQIYNGKRDKKYKYLITCYICGEIPIQIETNVPPELFNRMCEGALTASDRFELSVMGGDINF